MERKVVTNVIRRSIDVFSRSFIARCILCIGFLAYVVGTPELNIRIK